METIIKQYTIIELLRWGDKYLSQHDISNSKQEIEWILCFILQKKKIDLYSQYNQKINNNLYLKFKDLVYNRSKKIPLQHLLGIGSFYGRDFFVNKNVLIPRPETETIIDVLKKTKNNIDSLIDIGTGSGCLAITCSLENIASNIIATDISTKALKIAKKNNSHFKTKNITYLHHNILHDKLVSKFDVLISNPPYIEKNKINLLQEEVKHYDPIVALTDFQDGMLFYKHFIKYFDCFIKSNGCMILEIAGNYQKIKINKLINNKNLKSIYYKDLQNDYRVVKIFK